MNATTTARPAAPAQGDKPVPNQRTLIGRVTSTKMQKTLVVRIERRVRDPMMGKTITRSRKYHAHADSGEFRDGDLVEIAECRPISRTKSWRVTRLVEKSKAV
jgi:small subunit ribosomal protein S17